MEQDMRFLEAFKNVIGLEGGYVNDPKDHGGETKYGISKRSYPKLDIKNLSLEQAKAIYYMDFWIPLKLDQITDAQIAEEIFDTAVNCGTKAAVKIAQEALRFIGEDIDIDGIIGDVTIARLNKWCAKYPKALHKALNGFQFILYKDIVTKALADPKDQREAYALGWLKRIQYFRGPA